MRIWQLAILYAVAIAVFFVYKEEIADWMLHHRPSPLVAFGVALGFVLFPVIPYKIMIGTLGFMYGPLLGFLVSWSAASVAAVIVYAVVRINFQKRGRAYMAKFEGMDKVATTMEKHPFAMILAARLIPVLPQSLVNVYPAFLSIRLPTYAIASALGKIPSILLFAYLGNQLFTDWNNALIVIGVYIVLLASSWIGYRIWMRRA
jgi:uncharacterized membrane protein YdjX (TVP38/TMEM64 family)